MPDSVPKTWLPVGIFPITACRRGAEPSGTGEEGDDRDDDWESYDPIPEGDEQWQPLDDDYLDALEDPDDEDLDWHDFAVPDEDDLP